MERNHYAGDLDLFASSFVMRSQLYGITLGKKLYVLIENFSDDEKAKFLLIKDWLFPFLAFLIKK